MQERKYEPNVFTAEDFIYFGEVTSSDIPRDKSAVLSDKKADGKEKPWALYKRMNDQLVEIYYGLIDYGKRNGFSQFWINYWCQKVHYLETCSEELFYRYYYETEQKDWVFVNASFCRCRLCPICAWRRSLKIFGQISKIMNYFDENENYEYIFLTLTQKNVSGDQLGEELDRLFYGWKKFVLRKEFKRISQGFFRVLEVTYNIDRNDYHPHFHVVIAVKPEYFDKCCGLYLTQVQWSALWRLCLGLNYDPIVHVEKVYDKRSEDPNRRASEHKRSSDDRESAADHDELLPSQGESFALRYATAVSEVAKYSVKPGDYIIGTDRRMKEIEESLGREVAEDMRKQFFEMSMHVVMTLDRVLAHRRLCSMGGAFKRVHSLLNLEDPNALTDLVDCDQEDEKVRDDLVFVVLKYRWFAGFRNYYLE